MAFESKTYELIVPESELDSNYEDHEFLLCWYGRNGSFSQYMFTDREINVSVDSDVINEKIQDDIRSLVTSERRTVSLIAEDLTLNELETIGGMLSAEKIIRLKKDGTIENVAIESNSYSYRKSGARYNLEFNIRLWNLK